MVCFCGTAIQFYFHTCINPGSVTPVVEGSKQEHKVVVQNYLSLGVEQVEGLKDFAEKDCKHAKYIVSLTQNEFEVNGNRTYEISAWVGNPVKAA